MRNYIGTTLLAFIGIALGCAGIAKHLWLLFIVAAFSALGAVLCYPVRQAPRTAFGVGDFSGSTMVNVYTDADEFIRGTAREALLFNIIHKTQKTGR